MSLAGERCTACHSGAPMVSAEEEARYLPQVPNWEIVENNGIRKLRRAYRFDDWMGGVRFASAVAEAAELEDHHPTITVSWGKVTVTWWTHAIGGLHRNDFIMASRCDAMFSAQRSGRAES